MAGEVRRTYKELSCLLKVLFDLRELGIKDLWLLTSSQKHFSDSRRLIFQKEIKRPAQTQRIGRFESGTCI